MKTKDTYNLGFGYLSIPLYYLYSIVLLYSYAAMHNCTGRGPILVQKRANFFRDFEIETI